MIIAIDFDGTVVDHRYPCVGPDVPNAVKTLSALCDRGDKLILWTMRSGRYLDDAVVWFAKYKILLYGIQCNPVQHKWTESPKAYAQLYIDDAAFGAPLLRYPDFERPCIDWYAVSDVLFKAK